MKKIFYTLCLSVLMLSVKAQAPQAAMSLTLDDVIGIASEKSLDAFRNENMFRTSYWQYRYFKADRLPSLNLYSNPLDFNRSRLKVYNSTTNEENYVFREYLNSNASLSLSQKIGLTGGSVFIRSDLAMVRNLGGDKNTSYNSRPISIGFEQSLNGYNEMRWRAKIEPVKYEMAKKRLIQSKENLAIEAVDKFFRQVAAQIEMKIAETNMASADTLYKIGKGRFQVGTVTQNDLLSLELDMLQARQRLSEAKFSLQRAQTDLNSFLSLDKNIEVKCVVPNKIPSLRVSADEAITQAVENNPEILSHKQQLLTADESVAEAKSKTGFNTTISAQYGLEQSAHDFSDVYKDPQRGQSFRVGVNIPILDWGRKKGNLLMAKSSRDETTIRIKQERIDFEQKVHQDVIEFNLQAEQLQHASLADTVAQKRYDVTLQRFLIGKEDVIKLSMARTELESARSKYVNTLRGYWNYYYRIRMWTLYDFDKKETLSVEYDKILQQ